MINHIWSVLCRRSVVDKDSNNLSLFDVFEQLTVDAKRGGGKSTDSKKINIPIEYELVSFWTKELPDEKLSGYLKIEMVNPDGSMVNTFEQPLRMTEKMKRLRSRVRIKGLSLELSGTYLFRVSVKFESDNYNSLVDIPLEVVLNKTKASKQGVHQS